jgi:Ca2+/Na+ antiporter
MSADTMNATILAFTNTAAESMIIMNAIFFGVSDMGISTTVSQTAFYVLIIQGVFYLLIEPNSKIDWWIVTRDSIFLLLYLITFSVFLYGNKLEMWKALILLGLYIAHIVLMKYNKSYEIIIKKLIHRTHEIRALNKIARKNIQKFHRNPNQKSYKIDDLLNVSFELHDGYIYIDSYYKKKVKDRFL